MLDDCEANRARVVLLAQCIDEHEVAEALRHFLAIHRNECRMHPVLDELLAGRRFGLRLFALVVREDQVRTAPVEINRRTELAQGEGGTLDMPARTACAPHRVPRRLIRCRGVPQNEVERRLLVRVVDLAATLFGVGNHLLFGIAAH